MFKLAAVRTVWWPVLVNIPQDDGKTLKVEFDAEFEIPSQEEHDEFIGAGGDVMEKWASGNFKRVKDQAGDQDLPNGAETKQKMLGISYVRNAMLTAFYQAFHGRAASRKN